jgi:hypothetical protein
VTLVLASLAALVLMIALRLKFFLSFPADVTVDVVYPDNLSFPQVTVCNKNPFR